jgi:gamma-glutamyltranspeptidase
MSRPRRDLARLIAAEWSSLPALRRTCGHRCHSLAKTAALVSALELAAGDTLAHRRYAEQMQAIVEQLADRFHPGAITALITARSTSAALTKLAA